MGWPLRRPVDHALTNADGVGHYKGNFGNLLFLWDIVFGDERWAHQMFYPLAHSRREHSALRPGGRPYEEPTGVALTPSAS